MAVAAGDKACRNFCHLKCEVEGNVWEQRDSVHSCSLKLLHGLAH